MPSLAFPHPASRDEAHIIPATVGALNAIGPAPRNHELEAVVGVGEEIHSAKPKTLQQPSFTSPNPNKRLNHLRRCPMA